MLCGALDIARPGWRVDDDWHNGACGLWLLIQTCDEGHIAEVLTEYFARGLSPRHLRLRLWRAHGPHYKTTNEEPNL